MELTAREKRLLLYLAIFLVIVAWDCARRRWSPDIVTETEHYVVYSTATREQTEEIGQIAEIVYRGYIQLLDRLGRPIQAHPKLKARLFKNREEFRFCNRVRGWAEAFYRKPYCCQYYSSDEACPYHWMTHEATHQLNAEAARLSLPQWLEEGIACYVSTSRIADNSLRLGEIDVNTYPVWWLNSMGLSGHLDADKKSRKIIPLEQIVSGQGGPGMNKHFNLYYLHWWSLVHFLMHFEDGKYRIGLGRLIADGGRLSAFERYIGEIENVEREWYGHIRESLLCSPGLSR